MLARTLFYVYYFLMLPQPLSPEFEAVFSPRNRGMIEGSLNTINEPAINDRDEAIVALIGRFGSYSDYVNEECVISSKLISYTSERIEDSWIQGRNYRPLSKHCQLRHLTCLQMGFEEYVATDGMSESLTLGQEDIFKSALQSRQILILTSQKLVGRVILDMPLWKFQQPGLNNVDMYHEGIAGLIKAIDRFEIGKGVSLGTYAYLWIRQSIDLAFNRGARTVRFPLPVEGEFREIARYKSILEGKMGREPTIDEIARETGIAVDGVFKAIQLISVGSLFDKNSVDKERIDVIASNEDRPHEDRLFFEEFYKHSIKHGFSAQDFGVFALMYSITGDFLCKVEVRLSNGSTVLLNELQDHLVKSRGDMNLSRGEITIFHKASIPLV